MKEVNPTWNDEDVFQAARRRVIASLQSIIMYEYLPAFLGSDVDPYDGYKPDTHPGISHVFQSAAFRYGCYTYFFKTPQSSKFFVDLIQLTPKHDSDRSVWK